MRIESFTIRVWLLGVLVVWLAILCLLAFLGMGTHVKKRADDLSVENPLPTLPTTLAARLGPMTQYAEISDRPVFAEDRKPHPFLLGGATPQVAHVNAHLSGVIITPDLKMAMLNIDNGKSLRLREGGDAVQGWRLIALGARNATFEGPNGTQSMQLDVFNGRGGQPPTVLKSPSTNTMTIDIQGLGLPQKYDGGGHSPTMPNSPKGGVPMSSMQQPPSDISELELRAVRERIERRREQLRLMQQQQNQ